MSDSRKSENLEFEILWLDVHPTGNVIEVVGTETISRYDMSAALLAAKNRLLRTDNAYGFVVRCLTPLAGRR